MMAQGCPCHKVTWVGMASQHGKGALCLYTAGLEGSPGNELSVVKGLLGARGGQREMEGEDCPSVALTLTHYTAATKRVRGPRGKGISPPTQEIAKREVDFAFRT